MSEKLKTGLSLFLNLLIVVSVMVGFFIKFSYQGFRFLIYFTNLSNVLAGIASLAALISIFLSLKNKKENKIKLVPVFYHLSATCVCITLLVVVFFLSIKAQLSGEGYFSLFTGPNFLFHFLVPVLSIVDYVFFEKEPSFSFKYVFLSLVPVFLYAVFYCLDFFLHMTNSQAGYDWYSFLGDGSILRIFLVAIAFVVITLSIGFGLYFLNRIHRKMKNGEQTEKTIQVEEEILSDDVVGFTKDDKQKSQKIEEVVYSTDDYDHVQETVSTETGTIHVITKKVMKQLKKEEKKKSKY